MSGGSAIRRAVVLGALVAVGIGCRPKAKSVASAPLATPRFTDATPVMRLDWNHNPCRTERKLFPETVGGGGGFLDYNQDGRLDLLLVNGAPLPGYRGERPRHALYRNDGDHFTDVTAAAGLPLREYGMGAAVGDYDSDGWPDIFITGVGQGRLYRNEKGKFRDVTDAARITGRGWSIGAAWLDYDADGRLDLLVADYVKWTPATDIPCGSELRRQYCPPYQYQGSPPWLYRNLGNGVFAEVSARSGIRGHAGKTLSCTPMDANGDGWVDVYLANDTEPDVLLLNQKNGTFRDTGAVAGVSVNSDGKATGSMGVDLATPFRDRVHAIAVGNFVGQGLSLFTNMEPPGGGAVEDPLYDNVKYEAGVGEPTLPMSTFGLLFSDVDLDGWADLLVLNGHLDENLAVGERAEPYRQLPQLFQNRRDRTFAEVGAKAGLTTPLVGRGLAVGDYDNDGRQDFLAFENGGPVRLWRNETETSGAWIGVALVGGKSPRDGTGATVTVSGPGWSQSRLASTARSYLAVNDPRIHFGLGTQRPEKLEIRWSGGSVDVIPNPPVNQYLKVEEGKGLVSPSP